MAVLVPLFYLVLIAAVPITRGILHERRERRMRAILADGSAYFRSLVPRDQERFLDRVEYFLAEKEFHGRGIDVTKEMEALLGACAVQLTFRLPRATLEHFTRIVVFPDRFRSRASGVDHIGEVNPGMRAIVVSWKHFLADYAVPDDARNLGLHEMAHALWFENRDPNDPENFLDNKFLRSWRALAKEEAARIHAGKTRLFRDYAGTNQEEFFAVAVEYFFERPGAFKADMPDLYAVLSELLCQDPANGTADRPRA